MTLAVLSVLRDESSSLPSFFAFLEGLENQSLFGDLYFSFYENDSSDGTCHQLAHWLSSRSGSFISEHFGESPHGTFSQHSSRTLRLADARNKALIPLLSTDCRWLLVVDADVIACPSHVHRLLEILLANPNASMVCASTVQYVPDILGNAPYSYYDTWALRDLDGNGGITFLQNPFQKPTDRFRWMSGLPVSVMSAFGGMSILSLDTVRLVQARWDGHDGCEHWAFCDAMRQCGPVLACPTVMPLVQHLDGVPRWTETYAMRIKQFIASMPQLGVLPEL